MYINPILRIHLSFNEAKEFYDKSEGIPYFLRDEKKVSIEDVAEGKRNLIVGEPGVGKSELLKEIQKHLESQGVTTVRINLRDSDSIRQIDAFVQTDSTDSRALLLDALDEVPSKLFFDVLKRIENLSKNNPDLPIYLSARWVFISRYAASFASYRFISISPFTLSQVREYLSAEKELYKEQDIDAILNILSFRHNLLVIQIPRYLEFLKEYLKTNTITGNTPLSRNELFEYFIDSKLAVEETKPEAEDAATVSRRMLEKLAISLEIYQTNSISKDELMTFFDEVDSDLKLATLSHPLSIFYNNSLLTVSSEDIGKVAFDNTEFQEYLAAKEITRLPDTAKAAFSFAADPSIKAIYPTWFNALTFLVDMQPQLLEPIIEFSGLRSGDFRVVDEQFLNFIAKLNVRTMAASTRRQLFLDLFTYHNRWRQWLPLGLATALAALYDSSLESHLKAIVNSAEPAVGAPRYVPLANVAFALGEIFKSKTTAADHPYWRSKLITYATQAEETGVLQRHALFALEALDDPSVIEDLPASMMDSDELVVREFLRVCTTLDPDNPKSVMYFIEGTKRHHIKARYGLYEIHKRPSIKAFLETFDQDVAFRKEFLDQVSIFDDRDSVIVQHIQAVYDEEIAQLCKKALVESADYRHYQPEKSTFVSELIRLLKANDPSFLAEMIQHLIDPAWGIKRFFFEDLVATTISAEEVPGFIDALEGIGHAETAFSVMLRTRFYRGVEGNEIFEAGRTKLSALYEQWEVARAEQEKTATKTGGKRDLLEEFRRFLEPAPQQYIPDVFQYYNQNANELDPILTEDDRQRLTHLIINEALKHDPIESTVEITSEQGGAKTYKTGTRAYMFGNALVAAQGFGIDLSPFRQNIINFIPFAWGDQLKTVFEIVPNIKPEEMVPVIGVYKQKHSDLWRHYPLSFVEAVAEYQIMDAVAVLKEFVKESAYDGYARIKALNVLEGLSPDAAFLQEIFDSYKDSATSDKNLADEANALLITAHAESATVSWRISEVVRKAQPFIQPSNAHFVGNFEEELRAKTFAKPLLYLKDPKYQTAFLQLFDDAMALWGKGEKFHAYSQYLQEVAFGYFDNLKENRSYEPLANLERKIQSLQTSDGGNWLLYRLEKLHTSYLAFLGKPANIAEAVRRYNEARRFDNRKIRNSSDLFRHLQEAIETDLTRWINGEGAYDLIRMGQILRPGRQQYEKLIQRTLKAQLHNILLRRGFDVDVYPEVQLLDEKRIDFLVRYGFAGPIGIEVKLTSNSDMRRKDLQASPSFASMRRYMEGYNAPHGIFLVIDNTNAKNLADIKAAFEQIANVWVRSFEGKPKKK
jgi:hypothetical protein